MKRILLFTIVLVLALSLAACGANNANNDVSLNERQQQNEQQQDKQQQNEQQDAEQEQSTGNATVYPLTITDASGTEMTFEQAPERIVSLSPSETEVLFALGLGDRVVGVTDWCDFPPEAQSKPSIGSGFDGNAESMIAAEPDLVVGILSLNNPQFIDSYRNFGLNVYTSEPRNVQDAMDRIMLLGEITDTKERAQEVVAQMDQELGSVIEAVKGLAEEDKKRVYVEYSEGWTVGKGEFMDELITLAGGINIVDEEGWLQISEEKVIESNPDVILYPSYIEGFDETIRARSGWGAISAIEQDQFGAINDDLLSRPGPRITQGLIEVAKAIYPELVK